MKARRKTTAASLDDAVKIVEAGITKIVDTIRREHGSSDKPHRPRGPRAKAQTHAA